MLRLTVLIIAVVALLSACGSHHAARLGVQDCVAAWNGSDNAARRERVAGSVIRAGYTRAGLQLSLTTGKLMMDGRAQPNPNPVGCRIIWFNHDRWVAFVARRDGDRFRFRPAMLGREEGDQTGIWPDAALRSPHDATLIGSAKLAFESYAGRTPTTNAPWKKVMRDWFDNGRIDNHYPCAVVRAAVRHLPTDGPGIGAPVRAYERTVC
jgi:hypothetical protein